MAGINGRRGFAIMTQEESRKIARRESKMRRNEPVFRRSGEDTGKGRLPRRRIHWTVEEEA